MMHTVRTVNAALPLLEKSKWPSIVVVSSVSGREVDFTSPAYGAFKAALIHYAQGLAYKLAHKHIRVNSVSPGNVYFKDGIWNYIEINVPDLFKQALALNPNLAWGWLYSGWAKVALGEPELAIAREERAMRLSPQDPLTFIMRSAIAAICAMEQSVRIVGLVHNGETKEAFIGLPVFADFDAVLDHFDAVLVTDLTNAHATAEAAVTRFGPDRVLVPALLRVRVGQQREAAQ